MWGVGSVSVIGGPTVTVTVTVTSRLFPLPCPFLGRSPLRRALSFREQPVGRCSFPSLALRQSFLVLLYANDRFFSLSPFFLVFIHLKALFPLLSSLFSLLSSSFSLFLFSFILSGLSIPHTRVDRSHTESSPPSLAASKRKEKKRKRKRKRERESENTD